MLYCDSREHKSIRDLVRFTAGPTTVITLDCADFVLLDKCGHSLGIERKAVSDLLSSLGKRNKTSGNVRLRDQLSAMHTTYDYRMLLVEGTLDFHPVKKLAVTGQRISGWNYGAVLMILASIQRDGVLVTHTADKYASADWLRILHQRSLIGCVMPKPFVMQEEEGEALMMAA